MLSNLLGMYLKVSLSTTVVIVSLLFLLPLLRKRYAAKWRYAIWILLAVRLLIPFSITLPEQPVQIPVPVSSVTIAETTDSHHPLDESGPEMTVQHVSPPAAKSRSLSPVVAVWLSGASTFLLLHVFLYVKFRYSLRHSAPMPPSAYTINILGRLTDRSNSPEVLVSPAVRSPVLCGFLRTRLYLPHERYGDEEMEFILRHELVHCRRRDLWCKLLLLAAACLHWFNPLVHIMVGQAGKEMEFSCDDVVTKHLDKQGRAAYGSAILSALPRTRSAAAPLFTTGFSGSKATLKRRLLNLFDAHAKNRGIPALLAVGMAAVLLTGAIAYTPVAAAGTTYSNGTVSVSIPLLTSEQPELIGRFTLDGANLVATIKGDGGTGIGIGVSKSPHVMFPQTEPWETYVEGTGSSSVHASFVDLQGTYYVYAVSETDTFRNVSGLVQVTKAVTGTDDVERQFARFAEYGIAYDAAGDTATYGGERVALFVVRRADNSFDLCWYDRSLPTGALLLEGMQDADGQVTGIQPLDAQEARELLSGLYGAYESSDRGAGIVPVPYVLNGTQLGPDGFTATDLTRETAPEEVRTWMEACDAEGGGAYLWQRQPDDLYLTYVYYNLGGRYPWVVEFEDGALIIKLYSNNGKVTDDSYYLMCYQSDIHVRNVTLLLDGQEVSFYATAV